MKHITKKTTILLAAGLTSLVIATSAFAEDITLRLAGVHPVEHFGTEVLGQIKTEIESANVGLSIKLFPAGQLGSGEELLDDAIRGNIDLVHAYVYPSRDPALEVISLPFLASTKEEIASIHQNPDSEFNKIISESFDRLKIKLLGIAPEGFIGVVSNKKPENATGVGDKGLNIRVWGSQLAKATVESIGFRSTTMNWGEVFAALQSGAVDGAICCTAQTAYTTFAQSDVGKYYIPYNPIVEMTAYYASGRSWSKLSEEQKAVVKKAFANASKDFANKALTQEAEFSAKLVQSGYEVIELSSKERAAMSAHIREKVWPIAAKIVGKDVLDRLTK